MGVVEMLEERKGLIYLYCITEAKPSRTTFFEETGVKIYPIYLQGVYAIVSKVLSDEFDEESLKKNLNNMEWVERKTRQHEAIIEEIMKNSTVLPFKFATIFETEEKVKRLLRDNNGKLKKVIGELGGKEEWGFKIYCDMTKFKNITEKEDERIEEKDREIASASKGKAYFLKKKKDEFVKGIVSERIVEYTKDCFERLKRLTRQAKINKILPKAVTEKEQDMVLNAAFLINKKRIKELERILSYIKTMYSQKGLEFAWTGPWPPYNFCSLDHKRQNV
jgi:hypothetical protein